MTSTVATPSSTRFRTDIQALRGLAVLLVVFYHAAPTVFQGGFLGVDIFFVISGYLITNLVKKGIDSGEFSFRAFYWRRAKRLLPAAYCTFLVVSVLSAFLLTRREIESFGKELIGALTFTANIVLWAKTGYFEWDAQLKPLLHVWSLSIEEQYYLILPAALVFLPKKFWARGALAVLILSLAMYLVFFSWKPVATFYLLPTRAWELAAGSIAAISLDQVRYRGIVSACYPIALPMLLAIPLSPEWGRYNSIKAPVLCLATMIFILRKKDFGSEHRLSNVMVWFGGISYSLYLVHWPLFAFLNSSWMGPTPPGYTRGVCIVLSVFLAYVLFRFVETPTRHAKIRLTAASLAGTLTVSGLLMVTPSGILWATRNQTDYSWIARNSYGLDMACDFPSTFTPIPQCRTSDDPSIMVWGDSFAAHLVPGVVVTSGQDGVVEASRNKCGPFEGLSVIDNVAGSTYNRQFAESCFHFNQSVLGYLSKTPSIKTVVLSSQFDYYLDPKLDRLLVGGAQEISSSPDAVVADMKRTVNLVRSLGKRVVVVAGPPIADFDIARCYEKQQTGKVNLGPHADCKLSVQAYHAMAEPRLAFLSRLAAEAGVNVIRFDDLLCGVDTCKTVLDGQLLYSDARHFSYGGSEVVAKRMDLARLISAKAK